MQTLARAGLTLLLLASTTTLPEAFVREDTRLSIGAAPPPLVLRALLEGSALEARSEGVPTWESLRDQVVVLEFWATWCGSCVAAFPHTNELAERFANDPVRFLSIANEPDDEVRAVVARYPLNAWIGLDSDGATFDAYGVRIVPFVVLVDLDGKVAAITRPESVTARVIEDLLDGNPIDLPLATNRTADLEWDRVGAGDLTPAFAQVVLKRSESESGAHTSAPGSGHIVGDGLFPQTLFQIAFEVESHNLVWNAPEREELYKVSVFAPRGDDQLARSLLRATLTSVFDLQTRWENVEGNVLMLRQTGSGPLPATSTATAGQSRVGGNGAVVVGVSMDQFAMMLSGMVGRASVQNDTGLEGRFDMSLRWTPGSRKSIDDALATVGLRIENEVRTVRKLIVEPASS